MRALFILPAAALAAIVACGGAHDSDLFGSPSGSSGGGAADDSGVTTNGGVDGGGSNDASSGNDAAAHKDAGGGVDAGPQPDAGKPDSGPISNDPGIFCGKDPQGTDVFCVLGQQSCCAPSVPPGDVPPYKCIAQGSQCGGTRIACDDTADCPGKICCGAFDNNTQTYTEVSCRSSCSGQGPNGTTLIRICDPALMPSDCPQGTICQESGILPGFYYCN